MDRASAGRALRHGDRRGRARLWLAGEEQGVFRFDGASWTRFDTYDGLAGWHVHALAVSPRDGRIWIGTEAGISIWVGGNAPPWRLAA